MVGICCVAVSWAPVWHERSVGLEDSLGLSLALPLTHCEVPGKVLDITVLKISNVYVRIIMTPS